MTTIARLTCAEMRKLILSRTYIIGLAIVSVAVNVATAGKNGTPVLGTTASTDKMLKLGSVCCVAMLVLGIVASGGEYRHKTIIPAMLVAPRRGTLIIAKVIGITVAGAVLSVLTFGLGLATAVAELSTHHIHHLPADTGSLFAGSVGRRHPVRRDRRGARLHHPQHDRRRRRRRRRVLFVELAILHTFAPNLDKWLVTGAATTLTTSTASGSGTLTPAIAVAVLGGYAIVLLAAAARLVLRRDVA